MPMCVVIEDLLTGSFISKNELAEMTE